MLFKGILHALDRLIGQIEQAVEFAKIEFPSGEWGQGRGGGEGWQRLICIASRTRQFPRRSAGRVGVPAAAGAAVRRPRAGVPDA